MYCGAHHARRNAITASRSATENAFRRAGAPLAVKCVSGAAAPKSIFGARHAPISHIPGRSARTLFLATGTAMASVSGWAAAVYN
jgi:hypothetical protein